MGFPQIPWVFISFHRFSSHFHSPLQRQGMDLCLGDPDATAEPVALRDGTTITATVPRSDFPILPWGKLMNLWMVQMFHSFPVVIVFFDVSTQTFHWRRMFRRIFRRSLNNYDVSAKYSLNTAQMTAHDTEVKSFNDTRGFGFLKIPGANMDLYFHGRAPCQVGDREGMGVGGRPQYIEGGSGVRTRIVFNKSPQVSKTKSRSSCNLAGVQKHGNCCPRVFRSFARIANRAIIQGIQLPYE